MTINLGMRMVILIPTFLFLVGYIFKSLVESKHYIFLRGNIDEGTFTKIFERSGMDYAYTFALDSLFLAIANGLIIIFELGNTEIGIIAMIIGSLLSMCVIFGEYTDNANLSGFGITSLSGLFFTEFYGLFSYGAYPLNVAVFIVIFVGGTLYGLWISILSVSKLVDVSQTGKKFTTIRLALLILKKYLRRE